ncbi:helix-turn-helix domain-containing protein [Streptomyces kaniharaensis]|uniref:Helix-turn-helix domain-containing protein n=1 Tax=Streptomyces kaniharaensis TaxID=212423 RepID=A0A6N7KI86_9ACTN|nr:helix-turn-helix transcriptional regulator [Streptomyces kaniharaensis]MQS11200.1 helix-turn-helix domain-containing protein [Streptomyces kaniharaensis]
MVEELLAAFEARHIGRLMRAYRLHRYHRAEYGPRGVPQSVVAQWLGLTQAQVSRIETGPPVTDLISLTHYARVLGVPEERLWFSLPGKVPTPRAEPLFLAELDSPASEVIASQEAWRATRRYLNTHRAQLAQAASALYPAEFHVSGTALLMAPAWTPPAPVPLERVRLKWIDAAPKVPLVDGREVEARQTVPLYSPSRSFERYTQAVRYIDSPFLFENRPSYRLTAVEWDQAGGGELSFNLATYFDKLDVCEAVGHEFASAMTEGFANWARLPLRRLLNDPFDVELRTVAPAITTLLLRVRASGEATFLLHWRDPSKVATAGGLYDTIPAGEFQPSTITGDPSGSDFDLWRNIARELNEELLGAPEYDGSSSRPLDYDRWPLYRSLERARQAGRLRAYCFGVGCDALTLAATIPTALVIDDEVFEELFGEVVKTNAEGVTVTEWNGQDTSSGIPFTEQNVSQFIRNEPMAPPGAACLALTWKYRDLLLGS